MTSDVDVVRRVFQAVDERDLEGLMACYSPDVEIVESPALPYGGVYAGLEGAHRHAMAFTGAWGNFQSQEETPLDPQFVGDGAGTVAVLFRHRARDAATGRAIDLPEVSTYEVANGKITRFQMFHLDPGALTAFLHAAGESD